MSITMNWIQRSLWLLAIFLVPMVAIGLRDGFRFSFKCAKLSWPGPGGNAGEVLVGSGSPVVEQRRPNHGFTAIRAEGAMIVQIRGGAEPELSVTAQQNLQPFITTVVEGPELRISMLGVITTDQPITVTVSGAAIQTLELSGKITAQAEGLGGEAVTVTTNGASHAVIHGTAQFLHVTAIGASSIDASRLSATRLEGHAEGASRITLAGSCTEAHLEAIGASSVQAERLDAGKATLSAIGASSIRLGHGGVIDQNSVGASTIQIERK
jgi:Putative auto-transporter adhesin, head GIN domain